MRSLDRPPYEAAHCRHPEMYSIGIYVPPIEIHLRDPWEPHQGGQPAEIYLKVEQVVADGKAVQSRRSQLYNLLEESTDQGVRILRDIGGLRGYWAGN